MTVHEASSALGVNTQRIRALIASGRLAASKRGRDWWVTLSAIEACRATLDTNAKYKRKP